MLQSVSTLEQNSDPGVTPWWGRVEPMLASSRFKGRSDSNPWTMDEQGFPVGTDQLPPILMLVSVLKVKHS